MDPLAALRERLRLITESAADLIERVRRSWAADLARRRGTGTEDWVAYRLGGLDALAELAEQVGGTEGAPPAPPVAS